MLDVFIGQKLKSKLDSFDVNSDNQILFPTGTEVEIAAIHESNILIKFPDGISYQHNLGDLDLIFEPVVNTTPVISKSFKGIGTPPRELFRFMPSEAQWDYNYFYTVEIKLEKQSRKKFICQDCYHELPADENALNKGVQCPNCGEIKIPIAVDSILPAR